MIEQYYKRVKNRKVIELHVHIDNGDVVMCKIYPAPKKQEYYTFKELIEVEDLDSWLDIGINEKIFTIDAPEPEQSV